MNGPEQERTMTWGTCVYREEVSSLIPKPSLAAVFAAIEKPVRFSTAAKKAAREGLGTRLGGFSSATMEGLGTRLGGFSRATMYSRNLRLSSASYKLLNKKDIYAFVPYASTLL